MKKIYVLHLALALVPVANNAAETVAAAVGTGLAASYASYKYNEYQRSLENEYRSFEELDAPHYSHLTTPSKFDTEMRPAHHIALSSMLASLSAVALIAAFSNNPREVVIGNTILGSCSLSALFSLFFIAKTKTSLQGENLKQINNIERRIHACRVEIQKISDVIQNNKDKCVGLILYAEGVASDNHLLAQQERLAKEIENLEEQLVALLMQAAA